MAAMAAARSAHRATTSNARRQTGGGREPAGRATVAPAAGRAGRAQWRCRRCALSDPCASSPESARGLRRHVARAARSSRARRLSTAASVSATSSPSNARLPGEHLVEHAPERPDVAALVDRASLRLLGTHVRRRAEDHAAPVVIAGDVSVGELRRVRRARRRRLRSPSPGRSRAPSPCRPAAP